MIYQEDTIVALSTPPGIGAIGVIRLSGKDSITLTNSVFNGKNLEAQNTHTLHFGKIKNGEELVDEVVVGLFKEPQSYTKENVVEISCHGSPYIQQKIIELLIEKGARPATAGEFTMRAFLNGRMDLSQAEAVADLITSDSEASHKMALEQMRGGFSNKISELREKLIHFASMIELELDFAEEDVEFANRDDLKALITELQAILIPLIESFKLGNVLKNGVSTVIAGRPNAGKSTLLNALLQEERAIVSEIAGTTRDTIEEVLNIDGILFRLIDTAGIRDATDKIEQIGVAKTMEKINQSSLVIYVFDVSDFSSTELEQDLYKLNRRGLPLIVIGNKSDVVDQSWLDEFSQADLFISSKTEENLTALKSLLVETVTGSNLRQPDTIVSNSRHYKALKDANAALNDVHSGLNQNTTGDFLALDIRRALHALGEITGEITTDDLLSNIFSKFCIGK